MDFTDPENAWNGVIPSSLPEYDQDDGTVFDYETGEILHEPEED